MHTHTCIHTSTHIYIIEQKTNENLTFTTTLMDLEGIMINEINQVEKTNIITLSLMWNLKNKTN